MESLFQAIYTDVVRIDSDSSNGIWLEIGTGDSRLEIDAIKISGGEPIQIYASKVKSFSSEWSNSR